MERVAFRLKLRPNKRGEYERMHANVWPELYEMLKKARISNYTIWTSGDDVFGYYETPDKRHSNHVLATSPALQRWNAVMEAIYYPDIDPDTGTVREMKLVFQYDGGTRG